MKAAGMADGWEDCYCGGKLQIGLVIDRLVAEADKAGILPRGAEPEFVRIAREAGLPVHAQ